jgi:hypothetical protein
MRPPQSPKNLSRPRGNKLPKAEIETRILWVTDLLVAGASRSEILSQCSEKYGCGQSTTERYIKGATNRLKESYRPHMESCAELARRRFEKIYSSAMAKGDLRTAMSAQSNLCKLDGTWRASESNASSVKDALTALMKEIRGQEVVP